MKTVPRIPRVLIFCILSTVGAVASRAAHQPTLKDAFKDDFRIGAAIKEEEFTGTDPVAAAIAKLQFNSITPENVLKWEAVHPEPGRFDFGPGDRFVAFGEANGMFIVGHTLVWHHQTPDWVFTDAHGNPLTRDQLLARMRDHIQAVVGRYRGRIRGWDVVNEALNDDGTLRQSPWMRIIGEDYLVKAYQYAHEADPAAELYYNDYSLEAEPKRSGAVALVRKLQAAGVPLAGIGIQEHVNLVWPTSKDLNETIEAFGKLGIAVAFTELDIDVLPAASTNVGADVGLRVEQSAALNPYTKGLPDTVQQALAHRYAELFGVYLRHRDVVRRVTLWGVTDLGSWLNDWPVPGRTNYPLLFDRQGNPKPAFDAIVREASEYTAH